MSQKQIKRYRKYGVEAAKKEINDNLQAIQNELVSKMIGRNLFNRIKVAWLIILAKVE